MKVRANIKTILTILPVLGLALLLLLSPCKVRNYIQAELGVAQTNVTNKSQATLSNSSCANVEISANNLVKEQSNAQYSPALVAGNNFVVHFFTNYTPQKRLDRNYWVSAIPLYILYQKFKDYL